MNNKAKHFLVCWLVVFLGKKINIFCFFFTLYKYSNYDVITSNKTDFTVKSCKILFYLVYHLTRFIKRKLVGQTFCFVSLNGWLIICGFVVP